MNLIINASEALQDRPGQITIATGVAHPDTDFDSHVFLAENMRHQRCVYVQVSDTGIGMTEDILTRIFE